MSMVTASAPENQLSLSFPCVVDVSRIESVNDGLHGSVFSHWSIEVARKDYLPGEFDHLDAENLGDIRELVMASFDHQWTIPGVLNLSGYRPASMREFLAAAPNVMRHTGVNALVCASGGFILGSNKVEIFRRVPVIRRVVDLDVAIPHLMLDMGWYHQFWGDGTFMLYTAKP
jgi:hypothetical protein